MGIGTLDGEPYSSKEDTDFMMVEIKNAGWKDKPLGKNLLFKTRPKRLQKQRLMMDLDENWPITYEDIKAIL